MARLSSTIRGLTILELVCVKDQSESADLGPRTYHNSHLANVRQTKGMPFFSLPAVWSVIDPRPSFQY